MDIDKEMIDKLKKSVRVKSNIASEEIEDLAKACVKDLEITGVYCNNNEDQLYIQALKLYCKANYGYDKDSEKFRAAYAALKDSMALSGDYQKAGENNE